MSNKLDDDTIQEVLEGLKKGESHRVIAKRVLVSTTTISRIRKRFAADVSTPSKKEIIRDFKKDTGVITTRSLDVKTVEEALEVSGVDLDIWEVDRFVINSWEVTMKLKQTLKGNFVDKPKTCTNWQVKIWLKKKTDQLLGFESILESIQKQSPHIRLIKRKPLKPKSSERVLELSLFDPHIGLRCQKPASDVRWSINIAQETMFSVLEQLLEYAEHYGPFEYIVFPFGNDFLHTDNVYNTTTQGTHQPEAEAWKTTFIAAEQIAIQLVDRIKRVAPIKIIVVPGNHARQSEFVLGRLLRAYYHNDKNVSINAEPSPYKFHHYGVNLIGFEHGHSIKQPVRLAALMANECRDIWSKTVYREWHLGDQHRKGSNKPSMLEEQGVSVEYLPGLTAPNEWHRLKSFNWQKRAGLGFIWDKTCGPISRLQVNINNYTEKIMGV